MQLLFMAIFHRSRETMLCTSSREELKTYLLQQTLARGIDVPAIGNVINYDVPEDPNLYFHRIGRTARAGGEGKAISLVSNDRISDFERILAQTKLPIRKLNDELGVVVPVIASAKHRLAEAADTAGSGYGSRKQLPQ